MTPAIICALASMACSLACIANERATRRGGITFHHFGRYCVTISKRKDHA